MPDPFLDALSNPFVLAIISNVATGIVFYFIGRSSRRADRKQAHSVQLKDSVYVPWSNLQIYHQDVWYEVGVPKFGGEPLPPWDEPIFQWAKAHLEKADPGILQAWGKATEALDKEKAQVETVKRTIREEFAKQVALEFSQNPLRALPTEDELQRDVYFEDAIAHVVFRDVRSLLQNTPNQRTTLGVGWGSQTISSGDSYLGSIVLFGGREIARLQRQQDASVERWDRSENATVNNENVRQAMREVIALDVEASKQLALAQKGLRAQIQMIDNGMPIAGKCALRY